MFLCIGATGITLYVLNIVLVYSTDYCIWGSNDASVTHVNGLYIYNDNLNGYYEKIDSKCGNNTMYLYNAQNTWYIGPKWADTTDYIAYCNAHTAPDTPDGCGNDWEFPQIATNPAIQIYEDECPTLECDIIEALYWSNKHCRESVDDCCGDFVSDTESDYDNVYRKATITGTRYLYFSEADYRWICTKNETDVEITGKCLNLTESTSVEAFSLEPAWYRMKNEQVRKYSWSSNKNKTVYLVCETVPTQSTTPTQDVIVIETTEANISSQYKGFITVFIVLLSVFAMVHG